MLRLEISWNAIVTLLTGFFYLVTGIFVLGNLITTYLKFAFFTRATNSGFGATFLVVFLHCDFHFFFAQVTCDVFHAHFATFLMISDFTNGDQLVASDTFHALKLTIFVVSFYHIVGNFTPAAEGEVVTFKN